MSSLDLMALEIFPARVGNRTVKARIMAKGGAAAGGMNPKTGVAYIPIEDDPYYRNVRRHEGLHAIFSGGKKRKVDPTALGQGLEDMRIHVLGQKGINSLARADELVCAAKDLSDLTTHFEEIAAGSEAGKRVNLIPLIRSAAILHFGADAEQQPALDAARAALGALIPRWEQMIKRPGLGAAIARAISALVHGDNLDAARKALRPYMTLPKESEQPQPKQPQPQEGEGSEDEGEGCTAPPPVGSEDEDEGEGSSKGSEPSEDGSEDEGEGSESEGEGSEDEDEGGEDIPCSDPDKECITKETRTEGGIGGTGSIPLDDALRKGIITPESVELLSKETIERMLRKKNGRGTGLPTMEIHKLELEQSKRITEGRSEKPMMSGARIRSSKLYKVCSPNPGRLFSRRGARKGGTVLIDASGSMALDNERLAAIAAKIPIGQIAYYSGRGMTGNLVIFSADGRCHSSRYLPFRAGGNDIDLPALQWLLKQPAPRWFITDTCFCGGGQQAPIALELLARAAERKMLKVHSTIGGLEIELGLIQELDARDKSFAARVDERIATVLRRCEVCNGSGGRELIMGPRGYALDAAGNLQRTPPCAACNGLGHH